MKKTYTKPELFYECFFLLNSIAANCENVITSADYTTCSVDIPGVGMVFVNNGVCEIFAIDDKPCAASGAVEVLGLSGS